MLPRLITGLILAPLVIWLTLFAPKAAMLTVLALAAARCTEELLRMYPEMRPQDRIIAATLAAALAASPLLGPSVAFMAAGLAPIALLALSLVRPGDVQTASRRAALGVLSLGYIGATCAVLIALFALPQTSKITTLHFWGLTFAPFDRGRGALLSLFIVVFLGDTGAYFAGRLFGRHKLYEMISPKKTMQGAVGGLLASIAGGWIVAAALLPDIALAHALALGAVGGAVGQIGDLVESLFKRATNTKDSGGLLPGHGGLLDRVDGVLFAGPVLYAYLLLFL